MKQVEKADVISMLATHKEWLAQETAGHAPPKNLKLVLIEASLADMEFEHGGFSCADIVRSSLNNIVFRDCDFSYSTLIGSTFKNCQFINCSFTKADLREATMHSSRLMNCDLTRADLTDANFQGADLTGSSLSWVWLVRTDLRHVNWDSVQLSGARLIESKLYNSKRFRFGAIDQVLIESVYMSPDGRGEKISGIAALDALHT